MPAPLLTEDANSTPPRLRAVPLTSEYRRAIYDLIQEQAEQHASATHDHAADESNSQKLFDTITRDHGSNCFLVIDDNQNALAAVTYYECHTELGTGYYLEDIVTTKAARKHGIGTFALTTLSQMTLHDNFNYVALECAVNNNDAQQFYTRRGGERLEDRHTWRITTPLQPRSTSEETVTYRSVTFKDIPAITSFVQRTNENFDADAFKSWLATQVVNKNPNLVLAIGNNETSERAEIQGFAFAYRNFSTFRAISGLHIESLSVKDNNPEIAAGMIEHLADIQRQKGWTGHIDFTVKDNQKEMIEPVIESFGFAPLAYGEDRMVVRRFQTAALNTLARNYNGRNLIKNLVQSNDDRPHRTLGQTPPAHLIHPAYGS